MNPKLRSFGILLFAIAALAGCSSEPAVKAAKKGAAPLDRIQGKAQVLEEGGGSTDAALNASGSNSVYLWEGTHRYRLFLRTPFEVQHGTQYVAEGVIAQKAIEEIGDPDQGKNGYPLQSSCERVVRMAWNNLSFDAIEPTAAVVRARVKRYPARPLFLVTRIRQLTDDEIKAGHGTKTDAEGEDNIPEITVAADKQKALLIEGPTVQTAPLWEPAGGKARCKLIISPEGTVAELETGAQLCETVQWAKFRYQPTVQAGHPVKVKTEVEVTFEARK